MTDAVAGLAWTVAAMAAVLAAGQWAHGRFPRLRIADADGGRLRDRRRLVAWNAVAAFGTYGAGLAWFGDWLLRDGPSGLWQPLAALLLYDFAYYWLHRWWHAPRMMRILHGAHHRVRHPTAVDGLYGSPVETAIALAVLLACIAAVGPVGAAAFVAVVGVHTFVNTIDHFNVRLPGLRYWAARHDAHHHRRRVNYGISPLWDVLFRTAA